MQATSGVMPEAIRQGAEGSDPFRSFFTRRYFNFRLTASTGSATGCLQKGSVVDNVQVRPATPAMGRPMDSTAPKAVRVQAIRDRWFTESLGINFPQLAEGDMPAATCDQFIRSNRMNAAFSLLHEAPETAGMSADQALAHDRALNLEHFGVENPKDMMVQLERPDRPRTCRVG